MKANLSTLFDMQRFFENARLASIIASVEHSYAHELLDDDLDLVSAAGELKPEKGVLPAEKADDHEQL